MRPARLPPVLILPVLLLVPVATAEEGAYIQVGTPTTCAKIPYDPLMSIKDVELGPGDCELDPVEIVKTVLGNIYRNAHMSVCAGSPECPLPTPGPDGLPDLRDWNPIQPEWPYSPRPSLEERLCSAQGDPDGQCIMWERIPFHEGLCEEDSPICDE